MTAVLQLLSRRTCSGDIPASITWSLLRVVRTSRGVGMRWDACLLSEKNSRRQESGERGSCGW